MQKGKGEKGDYIQLRKHNEWAQPYLNKTSFIVTEI
jgi:hypothetical protein